MKRILIENLQSKIVCKLADSYISQKVNKIGEHIKLIDKMDKIDESNYSRLFKELDQQLEDWRPAIDLNSIMADPSYAAGLIMFYNMTKSIPGRMILIKALNKGIDGLSMLLGERNNAALIGFIKPHLYGDIAWDNPVLYTGTKLEEEIVYGMNRMDAQLFALETLIQQLIFVADGTFIFRDSGFDPKRKLHFDHIIINKVYTRKSIIKRLQNHKIPTKMGDELDVVWSRAYSLKTMFHSSRTLGLIVPRFLELTAQYLFTMIDIEDQDILDLLQIREDWGVLCGTHETVKFKDADGEWVEKLKMVRKEPDYAGLANVKRTLDSIIEWRGKAFHLPMKPYGGGRFDYISKMIGLNPLGSSWETAMFESWFKEVSDADAIKELQRSIAQEIGGFKASDFELIKYFKAHKDELLDESKIATKDLYERQLIRAYKNAINGIPSGFLHAVDATNSGGQFLGAHCKEESVVKDCNMAGLATIRDMYFSSPIRDFCREMGLNDATRQWFKSAIQSWIYGAGADTLMSAHKTGKPSLWNIIGSRVSLNRRMAGKRLMHHLSLYYPLVDKLRREIAQLEVDYLNSGDGSIIGLGWYNCYGMYCQSMNIREGDYRQVYYIGKNNKRSQISIIAAKPDHTQNATNLLPVAVHSEDGEVVIWFHLNFGGAKLTKHDDFRLMSNQMKSFRLAYPKEVVKKARSGSLEVKLSEALNQDIVISKGKFPYSKMAQSKTAVI